MSDTMNTLLKRASCRKFVPARLDAEVLEQIVKAGLKAPSGKNMQTPRFVIISNDRCVQRLSAMNAAVMGGGGDPFYGAKDVIAVLAKKDGGNYVYDGALAMGNMLNAAFSMGLGATWINRAKEVFDTEEGKALLKEWGVEGEMEGIAFLIVGKPDAELTPRDIVPGRVYYVR